MRDPPTPSACPHVGTMTSLTPPERFHALDATRAFALMLGVVFHAAWSYIGIYLSAPVADRSGGVVLHWFFFTSHAFRMQLFFLIAGFFARLLLQRRGWAGFVRHRLLRVGLPLVVAWFAVYPCFMAVWTLGANRSGRNLVELPLSVLFERLAGDGLMWVTRLNGGLFSLAHLWFLYYLLLLYALVLGGRWLLVRSPGVTDWLRRRADASLAGAVKSPVPLIALVLLTALLLWPMRRWFGVDLPAWTLIPLPSVLAVYAVFFVLGWLVHRQAHLLGQSARHWRWQLSAGLVLSVAVFAVYHRMERRGAIEMGTYPTLEVSQVLDWPRFLARLQAAEGTKDAASEMANLCRHLPPPARQVILRLTDGANLDARAGVLQTLMAALIQPAAFGVEPIPPGPRPPPAIAWPALAANRATLERLMDGALVGDLRQTRWYGTTKLAYSVAYSAVTWLLVLGTLGFFQERFPAHSQAWRYVADSSYWVYLVHLPLVGLLQVWLVHLAWPGWIKFALINAIAFPLLFASYHCLVRSTFIGRVLNGQSHPFVAWPLAIAVNRPTLKTLPQPDASQPPNRTP